MYVHICTHTHIYTYVCVCTISLLFMLLTLFNVTGVIEQKRKEEGPWGWYIEEGPWSHSGANWEVGEDE